jgi:hypothetical protein
MTTATAMAGGKLTNTSLCEVIGDVFVTVIPKHASQMAFFLSKAVLNGKLFSVLNGTITRE